MPGERAPGERGTGEPEPAQVSTDVSGKVDGVDLSGGSPVLLVGSRRVSLAHVEAVGPGRLTGANPLMAIRFYGPA